MLPTAVVLAVLAGCEAEPGAPPLPKLGDKVSPSALGPRPTANGAYTISWRSDPDPIPLSGLFAVETTLTDRDGKPVEGAVVHVDAKMPQHGHGMATRPEDDPGTCTPEGTCTHPGGVYLTRGMKFHMQGDWTIRFEVEGPAGKDHLDVVKRL